MEWLYQVSFEQGGYLHLTDRRLQGPRGKHSGRRFPSFLIDMLSVWTSDSGDRSGA